MKTDRSLGVGGRGGYASGTVTLAKNQTIYIYVGGQGATTENQQSGGAGGWNGGGTGGNSVSSQGNYVGAGGGGGASHVSLSNAQVIGTDVTTLSGTNYLIVAGGGGGAVTWTATAGAGGGTEGGAGATTGGTSLSPWYNSTLSTGRNGYNAVDYSSFSAEGTGGGGGGYLGGNAGTVTIGTSNQDCGGCGGSSNYNSTYVSNFTTTSDVREGAGKVTITFLSGEGTEASPYLIASTTDWDNLVSAVNGGETYSGNYFKMTANVGTVSTWMTGTFSGTFDGDGKTLTVGYSTSARYCAPFGTLGGTVKNLRVAGTLSSTAKNFGGIAAQVTSGKTATIENCRVSTSFTSNLSGDNSSGSFVGVVWNGGTLNITGCAFTGSLTGSGNAFGGFLGYKEGEGTCSMTDCLFAPASVTMSTEYAGIFSRPSAPTITNCYFTRTFGTAQGMQARTIAAGDYVSTLSVTKGDATATYAVSGITVYSGGIDFNDGSTTTFYGGSGQTVSLALTAETRSGYQFKQYAASQGTLSGQTTNTPTLTMPAANSTANDAVTISAEYDPTYNADFASSNDNDGWDIDPEQQIEGGTVTVSYVGENKVKSVTVTPKGALTGKFSVSSTKQVQFSKGNLQYDGSAWSFHTNQYDCVFTSISTATDYPMDIFCWGNIDNPAYDGSTGIGTNGVDLSGSSDWGSNTITNGCTGWRTLTLAEWEYLFANHSYGYATVAGQTGVIILPDVFTDPMRNNGSAAFVASTASWTANVYAAGDDWTAMEKAGALFLPAAGGRDGSRIGSVGIKGSYWSSTAYTTHGRFITFQAGSAPETTNYSIHGYGKSVRLVKDVE